MSGLRVRSGLREGQRIAEQLIAAGHVTVYAPPARWPCALFVGFWALVSHWWLG